MARNGNSLPGETTLQSKVTNQSSKSPSPEITKTHSRDSLIFQKILTKDEHYVEIDGVLCTMVVTREDLAY